MDGKKVWTNRMTFPRWVYLVAWIVFPAAGVISFAFLFALVSHIYIDVDMGFRGFVCNNKIWKWLSKKV